MPTCRNCAMHLRVLACSRARLIAGMSRPIRMAMMPMTTITSIRENPARTARTAEGECMPAPVLPRAAIVASVLNQRAKLSSAAKLVTLCSAAGIMTRDGFPDADFGDVGREERSAGRADRGRRHGGSRLVDDRARRVVPVVRLRPARA